MALAHLDNETEVFNVVGLRLNQLGNNVPANAKYSRSFIIYLYSVPAITSHKC